MTLTKVDFTCCITFCFVLLLGLTHGAQAQESTTWCDNIAPSEFNIYFDISEELATSKRPLFGMWNISLEEIITEDLYGFASEFYQGVHTITGASDGARANYVVVKPYIFTKTIPPKSNLAIAKAETEVALMWQFILPSGTVVKSLSYSQTSRRNWGNTFTFKKRARERIKEAFEVILDESCTGFKEVRSWLPIQFYAHTNDTLNLKNLIDSTVQVDAENDNGDTALMIASKEGHVQSSRLLIKSGADINKKNIHGDTPLHFASLSGNEDLLTLLLSEGANPNATNHLGGNPLLNAVSKNHLSTTRTLIEAGADLQQETDTGFNAIHAMLTSTEADEFRTIIPPSFDEVINQYSGSREDSGEAEDIIPEINRLIKPYDLDKIKEVQSVKAWPILFDFMDMISTHLKHSTRDDEARVQITKREIVEYGNDPLYYLGKGIMFKLLGANPAIATTSNSMNIAQEDIHDYSEQILLVNNAIHAIIRYDYVKNLAFQKKQPNFDQYIDTVQITDATPGGVSIIWQYGFFTIMLQITDEALNGEDGEGSYRFLVYKQSRNPEDNHTILSQTISSSDGSIDRIDVFVHSTQPTLRQFYLHELGQPAVVLADPSSESTPNEIGFDTIMIQGSGYRDVFKYLERQEWQRTKEIDLPIAQLQY